MCTISYSALFFFSPFLIAAKVLQLISLTPSPQKVPPNLPKVLISSCNPILQKKIQTHTPFTFRPHVQKQQILLFAFKIMSTVLSQYITSKLYCMILCLTSPFLLPCPRSSLSPTSSKQGFHSIYQLYYALGTHFYTGLRREFMLQKKDHRAQNPETYAEILDLLAILLNIMQPQGFPL